MSAIQTRHRWFIKMAGIYNMGLLCYANSVYQCLSNSQENHLLLEQHFNMHTIPDPGRMCHRCQLRYVFVRLLGPPSDPIKMNPIKPLYDVLGIALNSAGDPREFFIQTVRDHFPEFQVNYGFGLQTTVHCFDCNHTFTGIVDQVEIEIGSSCASLADGVLTYMAEESIDGYDCTLCENYTAAVLQRSITVLPPYLVLHRSEAQEVELSFVITIQNVDYILDSFIELVPAKSKKGCDHYITYKKLNQVWIRIDNENIRKAALSGLFKVNLAFYKNVETGSSVTYNIDFAQIKAFRARRNDSLPKASNLTEDNPVKKGRKKKSSQKLPTKSSIVEDSTVHSEIQDAVPSTSYCDQVHSTDTQIAGSAQSLIMGNSPPLSNPNSNPTNVSTQNKDTPSEVTNDPTNTQSSATVIGENSMVDPTTNLASDIPQNIEQTSTSTKKNDSSSEDTIIDPQNTSVEDITQLKITGVRSLVNELPNEDSLEKSSTEVLVGMSASELPPLELNKRLHMNVKKYVNLLKRYQEGNVTVKPLREQDARLTNIKERNIGFEKFQEFYKQKGDSGSKISGHSEEAKPQSGGTEKANDSDSSSEADDSEKDEPYEPDDDDQEQFEIEMELDAPKPKRKPSKSEEIARKKLSSTRVTPHVTRSLSKRGATGKPTKGATPNKKTKPSKTSAKVIKIKKNTRRDGVDEYCKENNIKYKRWTGTKGKGLHPSQLKTSKSLVDFVPKGQKPNSNCILCPMEKIVQGDSDMKLHFQRVHVAKLIVVKQYTLLLCRCSDVRSRGDDGTVRNRHFHCISCWQPFDTAAKLRIHKLSKHSDVYTEASLEHLRPKKQKK